MPNLTTRSAATGFIDTDLLYLARSPFGVTDDRKITISNIYNSTNLQLTSGQLNTIQDISSSSSPEFDTLTLSGDLEFSVAASSKHFIYTSSSEPLILSNNGTTENLRIETTDRVTINDELNVPIIGTLTSSGGNLQIHGEDDIIFTCGEYGASDVQRFRIQNAGNVGVGENTPNFLFHVNNTLDAVAAVEAKNSLANAYVRIWSSHDGSTSANGDAVLQLAGKQGASASLPDNVWYIGLDGSTGPTSFQPELKIGATSSNWGGPGDRDLITVKWTGFVGIGTESPIAQLDVDVDASTSYKTALRVSNPTSSTDPSTAIGVLFGVRGGVGGPYDKGAIVYTQDTTFGRGSFKILQNDAADNTAPAISDAVFEIGNNGLSKITASTSEHLRVGANSSSLYNPYVSWYYNSSRVGYIQADTGGFDVIGESQTTIKTTTFSSIILQTNNTTAVTIGTDQSATFDGTVHASSIDATSDDLTLNSNSSVILQLSGTDHITITSGKVKIDQDLIITGSTPSSSIAVGTAGEFTWDSSYLYICTATNTWRRVAHATW